MLSRPNNREEEDGVYGVVCRWSDGLEREWIKRFVGTQAEKASVGTRRLPLCSCAAKDHRIALMDL